MSIFAASSAAKAHPGVETKRQWLSDQSFAKKFGFEAVDATSDGYELLALSFDGTKPKFTDSAKKQTITDRVIYALSDLLIH